MPVDNNTAAKVRSSLSKEDLDRILYAPLSEAIMSVASRMEFERVHDPAISRNGIDVVLTEKDGITSYIAEKSVWELGAKSAFSFELSYIMGGYVEAGWLLDTMSQTTFLWYTAANIGLMIADSLYTPC